MSKSTDFLRDAILTDAEGNRSRIILVRGHEEGLDHTEIHTQSAFERENGIKTVHRVFSEEFDAK